MDGLGRDSGLGGDSAAVASGVAEVGSSSDGVGSLDEWLREEEDDGCVCRICRMPAEVGTPLFHPCRCSGSIKYVHEPCLIRWLEHSGKAACEVCGHEFSFTPVYAEDAPSHLPMMVLLWGTVKKGLSAAIFLQRALMVWLSWLVILPVTTCFMWRIAFSPTNLKQFAPLFVVPQIQHYISEAGINPDASTVIQSRMTPMALLFDCIQGSLLTAFLFILMMMITYVKDHHDSWITRLEDHFARQLEKLAAMSSPPPHNGVVQDTTLSHEDSETVTAISDNNEVLGNMQGSGSLSSRLNEEGALFSENNMGQEHPHVDGGASYSTDAYCADDVNFETSISQNRDSTVRWSGVKKVMEGWFEACGQRLEERLNWLEEKLHGRLSQWEEMVQERLRQWEENIQNHLDQLEDRVEERINQFEQPFERVLGLQGPLHNIFLNMSAVIFFCGVMIVGCIWIPLRFGWVIAAMANWFWSFVIGGCLQLVLPHTENGSPCKWLFSFLQNSATSSGTGTSGLLQMVEQPTCPMLTFGSYVLENQCFTRDPPSLPKHPLHQYSMKILSEVEAQMIPPDTSELAVLLVGWSWILVSIFVLMWIRSAWQVWARNGRHQVANTGVFFSQWLSQTVLGLFVVVKVITMFSLELIFFPTGFGYWLHLCMLPIFKATAFKEATVIALLFHWLCGMGFLLGFSSIVHLFREVVRPGALPFLKDPARPNRDPFADMAAESLGRQLACWVLSCVVYSVLGVVMLHFPARLARFLCTDVYPVKLLFAQVPVSQLPIDLLLFHMFLPFAVGHFMRSALRDNLRDWLVGVSSVVGLEEYLLTEEDYQRVGGRRQEPFTNLRSLFMVTNEATSSGNSSDDLDFEVDSLHPAISDSEEIFSGMVLSSPAGGDNQEGEVLVEDDPGVSASFLHEHQRDTVELEMQRGFGVRLGLLAVMWALSMIAFHIAMLVVPVVLGRGLCMGVFGIPTMPYDLFASYVGILTLCAVLEATRGAVNFGAREDVRLVVHDGVVGIISILKVLVFGLVWVGVTALLAGYLMEIVQRPIKMLSSGDLVPINMFRVWGSGVILLLMWHVRVSRLQRMNPQVPIPGNPWNQEIAALHHDGLWGMNLNQTITQLVLPVIGCLGLVLTCPWLACKLLQHMLHLPNSAYETIELHVHLVCFVLWAVLKALGKLKRAVVDLEMSIRDDHYLVRQELNNFNQSDPGWGTPVVTQM